MFKLIFHCKAKVTSLVWAGEMSSQMLLQCLIFHEKFATPSVITSVLVAQATGVATSQMDIKITSMSEHSSAFGVVAQK